MLRDLQQWLLWLPWLLGLQAVESHESAVEPVGQDSKQIHAWDDTQHHAQGLTTVATVANAAACWG